ncbi:isoprenoid synthase domain-containing protein [Mycena leptocephala]|nr:isoprenoid synthase domain-containing protein [Mycena leptocephala]
MNPFGNYTHRGDIAVACTPKHRSGSWAPQQHARELYASTIRAAALGECLCVISACDASLAQDGHTNNRAARAPHAPGAQAAEARIAAARHIQHSSPGRHSTNAYATKVRAGDTSRTAHSACNFSNPRRASLYSAYQRRDEIKMNEIPRLHSLHARSNFPHDVLRWKLHMPHAREFALCGPCAVLRRRALGDPRERSRQLNSPICALYCPTTAQTRSATTRTAYTYVLLVSGKGARAGLFYPLLPCWYRLTGVGMIAKNDGFMLEMAIYYLLKKHFRSASYYVDLLEIFHETTFQTEMGQLIDLITADENHVDLGKFSLEKHRLIVIYKTAYYSFDFPVALAMHLAGVPASYMLDEKTVEPYKVVLSILLPPGEYFQIQDDFLDFSAPPELLGKIGTDIVDNKCSWCINTALKLATPKQRVVFYENCGKKDTAAEARVKKV